jgi:hypothetical protein
MSRSSCFVFFLILCLAVLPRAFAHDMDIITEFDGIGPPEGQDYQHEDEDPFKGAVNLTVTNTGTIAWGDFHFEIFQVPGWPTVEDVHFITDYISETEDYRPRMNGSLVDFVVDNEVVGATLDLYYYADPVLPTETVNFTVYTDNTIDNVPVFGLIIYPTPIPEPATLALVGLGGLLLLIRRRRA